MNHIIWFFRPGHPFNGDQAEDGRLVKLTAIAGLWTICFEIEPASGTAIAASQQMGFSQITGIAQSVGPYRFLADETVRHSDSDPQICGCRRSPRMHFLQA